MEILPGNGKPCIKNRDVLVCKACSARESLEETGVGGVYRGLAYWVLRETSICFVLLSGEFQSPKP